MNGMTNSIVFYPAAIFLILFAVISIKSKNIFTSLLSAILVFFITGMFFYVLGSEYNAVIQIAIYGIAVPIILGIAIMFTNLKDNKIEKNIEKKSIFRFVITLTSCIFILALAYLVLTSLAIKPVGFNILEHINLNYVGVISAFGTGIYSNYVYAFEIVSLILTIIVVGFTMFQQGEKR